MKAETKTTLAFLAAGAALAATGIGTCVSARQLHSGYQLVARSRDTLAKLGDFLRRVQGGEIGAQGYLLTGQDDYLTPYESALQEIGDGLEDLRKSTGDDPAQARNIDHLQTQTNRHIAYLHRRVEARKSGGPEAVRPLLNLEGKDLLDQIRFAAAKVRSGELRTLSARQEFARHATRRTVLFFLALLGATAAIFAGAYRAVRRQVSRRLRTDAALRASEDKFRAVLDTTSDAMFVTDTDGAIQFANAQARTTFGYGADELFGNAIGDLLPVLGNGGDAVPRGKRKDQTLFPVQASEKAVEIGRERMVVHAIQDCSAGLRKDEALARAVQEAKRGEAELDQLTYAAASELTAIAHLGANSQGGEAVAAGIRRMAEGLSALSEASAPFTQFSEVPAQEALDLAMAELRELVQATGGTVEVPLALPTVAGNRAQIALLFRNLIQNAFRHPGADAKPRLTVTASLQSEELWRFSFRDEGPGIPPQYRARLFLPFLGAGGEKALPGAGTGLAVCRRIVERHGGCLWIDEGSTPGANFLCTLPAAAPPTAATG